MMSRISSIANIGDMQRLARKSLPLPVRDYLEGGADDEWTMRRNVASFDDFVLRSRGLVDVSHIDTSAELLGFKSSLPLMLSPTGMSKLFHHGGELSVALAAASAGVPYGLSTLSTMSVEATAASGAMRYLQLYLFRDREITQDLLDRAADNKYGAICLTTDTPVSGNRERDVRNGMTIPPRLSLTSILSLVLNPRWTQHALRRETFQFANLIEHIGTMAGKATSPMAFVNQQFDRTITWKDVEWLRARWRGKLVIKGLMDPEDCASAVACGVDAIMISNHGGRQLDAVNAPLDYLPAIRDRIQNGAQLILDGGVRRGTHVLKALALGADGCSIGRPYLYGLSVGGEAGVARVIEILRSEIERDMTLMGRVRIADVTRSDVEQARLIQPRRAA